MVKTALSIQRALEGIVHSGVAFSEWYDLQTQYER